MTTHAASRTAGTDTQLSEEERAIVGVVRDLRRPAGPSRARELEHANTYPEALIDQMKTIGDLRPGDPRTLREVKVSTPCYAWSPRSFSRGWMSLAGAMGGHTVVVKLLLEIRYGGPAPALPPAHGQPGSYGHHGPHRTRGGSRPGPPDHQRHPRRRRLGDQTARRPGSATPAGPT